MVMGQLKGVIPGRVCAFVHDELITDCKRDDADQVAYWQDRLMIKAAEQNMPNVKMRVDTHAMTRWTKKFPKGFEAFNQDGSINVYNVPR